MKTFEEYLGDKFAEEVYVGTDDNMPDSFDRWMSQLDVSEVMIHADGWMNEYKSRIRMAIHNVTK